MRKLTPCPASPNCVSSQAADAHQHMPAMAFEGDAGVAQQRLEDIVRALPRARIVRSEPGLLVVEFRSRIFRFVDDVEFAVDAPARLIHFRSAARMGYSDFGVNRRRMQDIAAGFAARRP